MKEILAKKEMFVICHNNNDIIHYVNLQDGNILTTSQEFVEEFNTLEEAKIRVNELAEDDSYFDENFNI